MLCPSLGLEVYFIMTWIHLTCYVVPKFGAGSVFYNDMDTFNVLCCAQVWGWKCIVSSTIGSKRESLVFPIEARTSAGNTSRVPH